MNIQSQTFDEE